MKKVYEKPALFAESYQMVEHISSGCTVDKWADTNHLDSLSCAILINDGTTGIFNNDKCYNWLDPITGMPIPTVKVECYNTFSVDLMFSS